MIHVDTPVYPELRQLFGAYLNVEFAAQYGSVNEALAAYRRETGPGHRAAARAELDRLTAAPGAAIRLAADLAQLGCEVNLTTAGEAWGLAATIRRALDEQQSSPER
jgi:contact-dependent growth inhibition (CDI) system CdiI-like immunity protein